MSAIDLLTSATIWTSAIIVLALIYQWWRKPHPNFPPLVRGFPLLGVLPYLDNYPQKLFKKWSLAMKAPIISVRMGITDTVILNTHEAVHETLQKQSLKFAGRPPIFVYDQVAKSHGLILKDYDERYRKIRNFASRYIKKSFGSGETATATAEDTINEEVDYLISELKQIGEKPLDLRPYIFRFALNVISKVVAGNHWEYNDQQLDDIVEKVTYLISESQDAAKIVQINLFPSLRYFPPFRGVNEKAKTYMELLCSEFIDPMIEEHKERFDPDNIGDYIDAFLFEHQHDKDNFNIEELRQGTRDLFMAGSDTIASSIAWMFLCYLHFSEHQKAINDEIDEVLDNDGVPSLEHKDEMPFTFAFVLEVMRFRTTNNLTFRKTKETVTVMGYTIPKETTVWVNNLGIHKDPETWKDPDKFDPYRHIDEDGKYVQSPKLHPYGAGFRACLGETLARREVFITFVKLLQSFQITSGSKILPSIDDGYNNLLHSPFPYKVILKMR